MLKILPILMVLACESVYASEHPSPTPTKGGEEHQAQHEKTNPVSNQKLSISNTPSSIKDIPPPQTTNKHPEGKSNQENEKSSPEEVTAWSTVALAIITFLLAVSTEKLWRATERLVKGAEETAQRQLRAYVNINGANILDPLDPLKRRATIEIKNFGGTPANECTMWINTAVREWPLVSELEAAPENLKLGKSSLPPNRTSFIHSPIQMCGHLEEQLLNDAVAIYVYGQIRYKDIFNTPQYSNFRLICTKEGFAKGLLAPDTEGNDAT